MSELEQAEAMVQLGLNTALIACLVLFALMLWWELTRPPFR